MHTNNPMIVVLRGVASMWSIVNICVSVSITDYKYTYYGTEFGYGYLDHEGKLAKTFKNKQNLNFQLLQNFILAKCHSYTCPE